MDPHQQNNSLFGQQSQRKFELQTMQDISQIISTLMQHTKGNMCSIGSASALKIMRSINLNNPKYNDEIISIISDNKTCLEGLIYIYLNGTRLLITGNKEQCEYVSCELKTVVAFIRNLRKLQIRLNLIEYLETFIQFIVEILDKNNTNKLRGHICDILIELSGIEDCSQIILNKLYDRINCFSCYMLDHNQNITQMETEILISILHIITEIFDLNFESLQKSTGVDSRMVIKSLQNIKERVTNGILSDIIISCLHSIIA